MPNLVASTLALAILAAAPHEDRPRPFEIVVVDEQTGRGVPLVTLETVNNIRFVTDSNGVVAFDEPGLMDRTVFFHVRSHGYEYPKDGFGYRGKALAVKPGGSERLTIKRLNVAERLYRVTGAGIYRDSVLTGRPIPIQAPVINGLVLGSDSVVNTVFHGKIHWFWGDTNRPGYPLGNFHVPGATSLLPADGGLDPERGVDLQYFVDEKGFAKPTCKMPGVGPTWIFGLVTIRDGQGHERMFAHYVKVRNLLEVYEHGLVEFDDQAHEFKKVCPFPFKSPIRPGGQPVLITENGTDYVAYAMPYPLIRVRADVESLKDISSYESFTCLKPGSRADQSEVDRDEHGRLRYRWKRNTAPVGPAEQARLVKAGRIKADEVLLPLRDVETGKGVSAHAGSVYWNAYHGRWVMIMVESFGTSLLGEIWFAEADTPLGPWVYARKVVTHDRYSFYNPKQHPMFDKEGGRIAFFEGTYTHTFSGNNEQTPRYDYNQVMYKLDLADARLNLPVAYYGGAEKEGRFRSRRREAKLESAGPIAFFALEHPASGAVPIFEQEHGDGDVSLHAGASAAEKNRAPLFHGLPADSQAPGPMTTPLYEYVSPRDRRHVYTTDPHLSRSGYERTPRPVCLVWRNFMTVPLP